MTNFASVVGPEDIKPGMTLAVLRHLDDDDDDDGYDDHPSPFVAMPTRRPPKQRTLDLRGQPMLVVSVQIPYVACLHIPDGKRIILDTRDMEFTRVEEDYCRFLVSEGHYRKTWPQLFREGMVVTELPAAAVEAHQAKGSEILAKLREHYGMQPERADDEGVDPDEIRRILEEED